MTQFIAFKTNLMISPRLNGRNDAFSIKFNFVKPQKMNKSTENKYWLLDLIAN